MVFPSDIEFHWVCNDFHLPSWCCFKMLKYTMSRRPTFQTWSSRDLSLGLETSRDPFLQVLVSVLVLEPQSLGLGLGLGTSESWSWSWSWNPRVSVSVLVLGLATMKTRFSSLMKREIVRLPPLLPWNGYLATVVCWCRQTGLEWVTTCCHSWSACDATICCKFSCCCTVGISL